MEQYLFNELPTDVAEQLATGAGVMLDSFDIHNKPSRAWVKSHILFATTGGINHSCVPTYTDMFEDVDNAPKGTKEGMELDTWEAKFSGTAISYTAENIKSALGAATIAQITEDVAEGLTVKEITPEMRVENSHFKDLWYVVPWKKGKGYIVVQLVDALSDGGFVSQSTDAGKGQISFSYTGHPTITDINRPPMRYYVIDATDVSTTAFLVEQILAPHISSDYTADSVAGGTDLVVTLTAASGYTIESVTVTKNGVPVGGAFDDSTSKVSVDDVDGDLVITVAEAQGA